MSPTPELRHAVETILAQIQRLKTGKRRLLVALDGGSGAGKSTLAGMIAAVTDAALIRSDDFYAAHISDAEWNARTAAEKARDALDWRRLRAEALEPLLAGKIALWRPFDFSRPQPNGTYPLSEALVERQPAEVIILDGAYSARPELADLIDLAVLVDVPVAIRHQRLLGRESADFLAGWHRHWDEAEAYYFTYVRPRLSFDLVVTL